MDDILESAGEERGLGYYVDKVIEILESAGIDLDDVSAEEIHRLASDIMAMDSSEDVPIEESADSTGNVLLEPDYDEDLRESGDLEDVFKNALDDADKKEASKKRKRKKGTDDEDEVSDKKMKKKEGKGAPCNDSNGPPCDDKKEEDTVSDETQKNVATTLMDLRFF